MRHELQIVLLAAFVVRAQDLASDASKSVDGYFDGHLFPNMLLIRSYGRDARRREAEVLEKLARRCGLAETVDADHRALQADVLAPDSR